MGQRLSYSELLYRRGFYIGPAGTSPASPDIVESVERWPAENIGNMQLRHDPACLVQSVEIGCSKLTCIGIVFDIQRTVLPPARLLEQLLAAWATSWDAFFERLMPCGGTFLLAVTGADGTVHLVPDATSSVQVCYAPHGEGWIAGSHPTLLADIIGEELSELGRMWPAHKLFSAGGIYFPGIRTQFASVVYQTPNHRLSLADGKVTRFFPTRDIVERPLSEILDIVCPMFRSQLDWAAEHYPLAIALSGGLDTRLTLAASRDIADRALYFTWQVGSMAVHVEDMAVASQLTAHLGLRHQEVRGATYKDPDFRLAWSRMLHGTSNTPVEQQALYQAFPEGTLHIRSNILETVRGFYTKNAVNQPTRFTGNKLGRLFRGPTGGDLFTSEFEEFMEVTDFTSETVRNYHYSDLFYWEHRMGVWLGSAVRSHRSRWETLSIYNNWLILEIMLGRPMAERNKALSVLAAAHRLWPESMEVPIYSGNQYLDSAGIAAARLNGPA